MKELIDAVIKIGVPIPTYSYEYKKFITEIPKNIPNGNGGKMGIIASDMFDTFEDACLSIIEWSKKI